MSLPVILRADVPGLGQIGDKKNVKEGYARNYLIPKSLAVYATANEIKRAELQKSKIDEKKAKLLEKAKAVGDKVSKVGMVFEKPVGHGGRLFGSVTANDLLAEFSRQGASIEKKSILMNGPIKTPGDHKIRVRIHSQVVVDVPVTIKGIEQTKTSDIPEDDEVAAPAAEEEAAATPEAAEEPKAEEEATEEK